ncbi:MAG TPA: hypothetical protein VHM90_05745 [Phycisphaerae bacterium]|jgi:hypothetical protein|nr:hypothetical protein [Phycisphaerae bacterium]
MMGSAYWHWAELFRGQLAAAVKDLPVLAEAAMMRALGHPHKDDTQMVHSVDELVRQCLLHHRAAIVEKARGREASLDVAHLHDEKSGAAEAVAILGTCCAESGSKESEQIVVRQGVVNFVLFTQRSSMGADPRVRRAIHFGDLPAKVGVNNESPAPVKQAARARAN